MITASDLKNMDYVLAEQSRIINESSENKKIIIDLRNKIDIELRKLKIKIK